MIRPHRRPTRWVVLLLATTLAAAACSGGSEADTTVGSAPPESTTAAAPATSTTALPVFSALVPFDGSEGMSFVIDLPGDWAGVDLSAMSADEAAVELRSANLDELAGFLQQLQDGGGKFWADGPTDGGFTTNVNVILNEAVIDGVEIDSLDQLEEVVIDSLVAAGFEVGPEIATRAAYPFGEASRLDYGIDLPGQSVTTTQYLYFQDNSLWYVTFSSPSDRDYSAVFEAIMETFAPFPDAFAAPPTTEAPPTTVEATTTTVDPDALVIDTLEFSPDGTLVVVTSAPSAVGFGLVLPEGWDISEPRESGNSLVLDLQGDTVGSYNMTLWSTSDVYDGLQDFLDRIIYASAESLVRDEQVTVSGFEGRRGADVVDDARQEILTVDLGDGFYLVVQGFTFDEYWAESEEELFNSIVGSIAAR